MERTEIYQLLKQAFAELTDRDVRRLPDQPDEKAALVEYGVDMMTLGALEQVLETRLPDTAIGLSRFARPDIMLTATMGDLITHLENVLKPKHPDPLMVYVDDEEENLFVFKRKFGSKFKIKTFTDPTEALAFILSHEEVKLVVTDEVMPNLRGNELCDAVKRERPSVFFVLITANPEHDNGLMFNSLRHNRFYDFIQKPVDFDAKTAEYTALFTRLLGA